MSRPKDRQRWFTISCSARVAISSRSAVWLACALVLGWAAVGCDAPPVEPDGGSDAGADAGPPPPSQPASEPLIDHVDPFIGTGGLGFNDLGSAFPGPQRPFGMIRVGPDTAPGQGPPPGFLHCSGFAYTDEHITGFSHARMHGTGIPDYGNLALMPVPSMEPEFVHSSGAQSRFVEGSRAASPGFFEVTLERGDIHAELTSRARVALHRYTFADGAPATVLIDAAHSPAMGVEWVASSVTVDTTAQEVSGYAQLGGGYSNRFGGVRIYFVARFDRPFIEHGTWGEDGPQLGESVGERGAWVSFDPSGGAVVRAEVAMSFVDVEGARANLAAETAGFDFDSVRDESAAEWEQWLSRVRVEGRSETDFRRFYTALYHSLLMPTLASDVDGRYRGVDGEVHSVEGFDYFTDFSLWDTFRTLHPLLTLLYPEVQTDMLRSLTQMAVDGGAMPRWPLGHGYTGGMLGEPAAIVMADSWQKGVRDFDLRAAYDAMVRGSLGEASEAFVGRGYTEPYERLGYVTTESGSWSASRTLEFAYGDSALATLADALGETEDAARFRDNSGRWRNQWDPEREFFVGRAEDGSFSTTFDEDSWQRYYSEGNAWQFLWYVPHDLPGLATHLGGRDVLLERLTGFFERSLEERRGLLAPEHYWHGNEPDLHASFIFAALGEPEPTARWSRWIARTMYGDGPTGLPGNDDGGTLSAWLVFASLGLFTIAGDDDYLIGSPLMTHAELAVGDGVFVIDAPEASDVHPVVDASSLDGTPLSASRLPHASITAGGELVHSMR